MVSKEFKHSRLIETHMFHGAKGVNVKYEIYHNIESPFAQVTIFDNRERLRIVKYENVPLVETGNMPIENDFKKVERHFLSHIHEYEMEVIGS